MCVLGVVLAVLGWAAVSSATNGRLPLVLAALFGQGMPVAPSYNSLSQSVGAGSPLGGNSLGGGGFGSSPPSYTQYDPNNWNFQ